MPWSSPGRSAGRRPRSPGCRRSPSSPRAPRLTLAAAEAKSRTPPAAHRPHQQDEPARRWNDGQFGLARPRGPDVELVAVGTRAAVVERKVEGPGTVPEGHG